MVQEGLKKIVIICGPTAVGKTAVAIELAGCFGGEIVNADSQQVWRGLDIGTAKPRTCFKTNDPLTLSPLPCGERVGVRGFEVPHHLIDIVNPDEHFDASVYVKLADDAIRDIAARGKKVFVVGGTGMYLRMLVHGLCDAPPRNQELRLKLAGEIETCGIESLRKRLCKIDPVTAKVVHQNDRTRIIRALEIFETTGIAASEFYRQHQFAQLRYDALKIGLYMPREELYKRINDRVDKMIANGLVDEVRELVKKYGLGCQALSAVGYKEIVQLFNSENPPSPPFEKGGMGGFIDLIKRNTRRYAKRQLTWFRADPEIRWHNPLQISVMESEIDTFLHSV